MTKLSVIVLLATLAASAQAVDSNSITVAVSRTYTVPADQATFQLQVTADLATDLASVSAALLAAGVPAATLNGVSNLDTQNGRSTYAFTFAVPYAKIHDQLAALQKSATALAKDTRIDLQYDLAGSTAAPATVDEAVRKLIPDLIADARARATTLATAAGASLGALLAIADLQIANLQSGSSPPTAVARSGDFTYLPVTRYYPSTPTPPTITATTGLSVKFQLLR